MVPVKRQKVKAVTVDLGKIPACGLTARGLKLSHKPVQSVELLPEGTKPPREKAVPPAEPGPKARPGQSLTRSWHGSGLQRRNGPAA